MRYPFGYPEPGEDVLWRLEARRYSVVIDPDADVYGVTDPRLEMFWFRVTKRTPRGARIGDRFVNLTAVKQWACETEAKAIAAFRARKQKQIAILSTQLDRARKELALLSEDELCKSES